MFRCFWSKGENGGVTFIITENSCFLRLQSKLWLLTHFSFLGEDLHLPKCSTPSVALFASLFLLCQAPVPCLTRGTQCARSAAAASHGTWWRWWWIPSKRPLCSGLRERWMTVPTGLCTAAAADGLVQEGPLLCSENNAFKLNPQGASLTKRSFSRTQRLQIGFLCTVR